MNGATYHNETIKTRFCVEVDNDDNDVDINDDCNNFNDVTNVDDNYNDVNDDDQHATVVDNSKEIR